MTTGTAIKVELSGVHPRSHRCASAVDAAMIRVQGVYSRCDLRNGTVTLTASDEAAARKALAAFAAAGFYGTSDNDDLQVQPLAPTTSARLTRAQISGIHNCCPPCCNAIDEAISSVPGVTGHTARPGVTRFFVTGDFESGDLVRALNESGFSAIIEP
ncbi:hypothetical protein [Schlesneria sp. T3-172]|uniref:hypothetical protein n=1 Tax=Schlesneria sphaerica TaxID=3373610 RepID=UPI0037CC8F7D